MKYILILSLVFSLSTHAVIPIKEGQKSPETGYIFNVDEEKQIRTINEKRLKLEDLAVKQDELNKVQSERIVLLEQEVKNSKLTGWQKVGYVFIGVLTTATAVYLAGKLKD